MHVLGSTRYSGRIDAGASLSDLVILWRDPDLGGDGSVLVYGTRKGVLPVNWMPAGSEMTEIPGGMAFTHRSRGERLEVYVQETVWEQAGPAGEQPALVKLGAERELSDLIARHPGCLNLPAGTVIHAREHRTSAGPVDLLAVLPDGRPAAVEVKRTRIAQSDVWQARRYQDALARDPQWEGAGAPLGVLAAPVLAKAAKELVDADESLSFARVHYRDLAGL